MKILIALVLISFAYVGAALADEKQTERMDLLLQEFDKGNAPGIVVGVLQDGEWVYQKSIGMANLEYAVKMSDDTVFDIASLAKQFTGYAIACLINEGKLSLDDQVKKHLPALEDTYKEITIRHLAYHTSGIRDIGELYGLGDFSPSLTSTEAFELIQRQSKLNFPHGSEHDYSNSNYVLLALVVEKISGQSFREWCADNIFEKLDMTNSFVNDDPRKVIKNRAIAYYGEHPEFSFDQDNGMALIGSSAVYSSLTDMQKWLKFLVTTSVIEGPTQLMVEPGKLDGGESAKYGLGLSIHPYRGMSMIEHSGATPSGFRTQLAFFPKEKMGFVVLSNWGDVEVLELAKKIIDVYLGETPETKIAMGERPKAVTLSPEQLQRFVGDFILDEEYNLEISVEGEQQLAVELEGRGVESGVPISADSIYIQKINAKMQFIEGAWDSARVFEGDKEVAFFKRKVDGEETPRHVAKPDLAGSYWNDEMDLLFTIEIAADGRVILHKSATTSVELVHRSGEQFRTANWDLSRVEFLRDDSGLPNGLSIDSGNRCRDVQFIRLKTR